MFISVLDVPMLLSGAVIPGLDYADDIALMASSAHGLQHLIHSVSAVCVLMGMSTNVAKTRVLMIESRYPGPY